MTIEIQNINTKKKCIEKSKIQKSETDNKIAIIKHQFDNELKILKEEVATLKNKKTKQVEIEV